MPSCVSKACKNQSTAKKKDSGVTYHRFPRHGHEKREAWIRFVQKNRNEDTWLPSDHTLICSDHFKHEDKYITKTGRLYLKKCAVPYDDGSDSKPGTSELVEPISEPINESEPATTSTENDGKSTKFPQCDECKKPVGTRELYRCVQCPLVVMCADCGRSNAHSHHCVLRMPSLQIYNKVEYLFELLTEVFHKKLIEKDVDDNANDDGDDDNDDGSDNDNKEEVTEKELEITVHQEDDGEDKHQTAAGSGIPGPSKKRKSSASTFLSSWRNEASAPEPPDEAIPTSHIKTEPDTDPLAFPLLFNVLQKPTDEPNPKKQRTMTASAPKKDNATELYTDEIVENIKREELEEVVEVKLEPLDSDAALLDTEKYALYGSHRADNTDL